MRRGDAERASGVGHFFKGLGGGNPKNSMAGNSYLTKTAQSDMMSAQKTL